MDNLKSWFKREDNKIIVFGKEHFDAKNTLCCGQLFRYFESENGYTILSKDKRADIVSVGENSEIITDDVDYFIEYFNLNDDYLNITESCKNKGVLEDVINYSKGLRIVKGDIFETIVSFVISANNNIKRIRKIINAICEKSGKKIDDEYFAFPTLEEFCKLDEEFFVSVGAGYRSKYLAKLGTELVEFFKEDLSGLSTDELLERLCKLSGVGNKVANCILLFAYNKYDSFPVDVWIERAYKKFYGDDGLTRKNISKKLREEYKNLSGYVQQYWFNYIINLE